MKEIVLVGLFMLSKLGFAWLAYLAVLNPFYPNFVSK